MYRPLPISTRPDPLFPSPTPFRANPLRWPRTPPYVGPTRPTPAQPKSPSLAGPEPTSFTNAKILGRAIPPINVVHAARRPRTKARPSPIRGAADQAVLDRIEMQVIQVPREIIGIADHVIEISALPEPPVLHARQPRSQRALEASDKHRAIGPGSGRQHPMQVIVQQHMAGLPERRKAAPAFQRFQVMSTHRTPPPTHH